MVGVSTGLDLHLDLSPTRPGRSLAAALREAVVDGRLAARTRLPAARTLAADLGLSRNTVAGVYADLMAEGWLESRVGAGTWVSDQGGTQPRGGQRRVRTANRELIDLRGGLPDATGFPRREWVAAVRAALAGAAAADFGYPDPAGTARLREALAGYLSRTRGVVTTAAEVVVGQGFGELLVLLCRALQARGATRVAVEEYGHATHRRLIASTGLELVPIPVDEDGADVTVLDDLPVAAVLLTPAHQFPVGVPLSAARRRRLVSWAERTDAVVLEDDYDGEFRYDRRVVGSVQALAPDRVVYLGTASKGLAPAVGLAWAVPPGHLLADVLDQRELSGGQPATLQQLAMAAFVDSHQYDRNVRRLRASYRARRTRLEQVVADHLPGCEVTGLAAGMQCLLRLPPGADEAAIERAAAKRGLAIEALSAHRAPGATGDTEPALVVGYGAPSHGQYERALRIMVDSINDPGF
ncbi:PLP-dependent aminotransferase family protein [Labedaea rhizosphaerae]